MVPLSPQAITRMNNKGSSSARSLHHAEDYKNSPTKCNLAKKNGWDLRMARIMLEGANRDIFGLLKVDLRLQFNQGNDQYPRTVEAAQDFLSQRKWQNQHHQPKSKPNATKPSTTTIKTSFARKEIICNCCGSKGRTSPNCTQKNKIPVEHWYVRKAMLNQVQ